MCLCNAILGINDKVVNKVRFPLVRFFFSDATFRLLNRGFSFPVPKTSMTLKKGAKMRDVAVPGMGLRKKSKTKIPKKLVKTLLS